MPIPDNALDRLKAAIMPTVAESVANQMQQPAMRVVLYDASGTALVTATALADAMANPTVPLVGSFLMGFNGTTWDRVDTVQTGTLKVALYDASANALSRIVASGDRGCVSILFFLPSSSSILHLRRLFPTGG